MNSSIWTKPSKPIDPSRQGKGAGHALGERVPLPGGFHSVEDNVSKAKVKLIPIKTAAERLSMSVDAFESRYLHSLDVFSLFRLSEKGHRKLFEDEIDAFLDCTSELEAIARVRAHRIMMRRLYPIVKPKRRRARR